MRHSCMLAIVLGISIIALAATGPATQPTAQPSTQPTPHVEVAFVLDTTGSMGGLIEGAKAKIWHIANQIILGRPRPTVKFGLVAYRDKGDAYVTKSLDLTDNIDKVYAELMQYKAEGGGDTPENVNQALSDAVSKLGWSTDRKTLKIIYLVGDSPPHNEYTEVPTYQTLAKAAITKGIYVNTVLCGNNADTAKVWEEISQLSDGKYVAIAQNGGVQTISTPYDAELASLNSELMGTVVAYGERREREEAKSLAFAARPAAPAVAADRATFMAAGGRAGSSDLVDAVAEKKVTIAKLSAGELPEQMQKMSPKEREAYIASMRAKREQVEQKIKALSVKRGDFIQQKLAETGGPKDGFDAKVIEALKTQAKDKGIAY